MTLAKVGELCEFSNGHGFSAKDWSTSGLPIIRIQNLNGSREFNYFRDEPLKAWIVNPGDLLFAWAGVKGVSFGPTVWSGPRGVLNQHIYRVTPRAGIDQRWLFHALMHVTTQIEKHAHGFKTSLVHVRKSDITEATVDVPPLPQQEKATAVLEAWDQAITAADQLTQLKQQLKAGLMDALLTGTRRLSGFTSPWRQWHLGQLFQERVETNRQDLQLLSITREEGVILREDVDRKDTSSEDKSKYLRICPGDIGYNTMRMWQGVSAVSHHEGIVSPAYTVCIPGPAIKVGFAAYLFKLPTIIHLFYRYSQGLTSDTWNLKFHHFAEISVCIPDVSEQSAIADLLGVLDHDLRLRVRQRAALHAQRRGLLQRLFAVQTDRSLVATHEGM